MWYNTPPFHKMRDKIVMKESVKTKILFKLAMLIIKLTYQKIILIILKIKLKLPTIFNLISFCCRFCIPGSGTDMYMAGFEISGQPDNACVILFIKAWTLDTRVKFIFGCLGCIVLGKGIVQPNAFGFNFSDISAYFFPIQRWKLYC